MATITSRLAKVHLLYFQGSHCKIQFILENGMVITLGNWPIPIAQRAIVPSLSIGDAMTLDLTQDPRIKRWRLTHSRAGREIHQYWFGDEQSKDQISISGMPNIVNLLQQTLKAR